MGRDEARGEQGGIRLTEPELVPLSPAQRREVVRLLAALIRAARAQARSAAASPIAESGEDLPIGAPDTGKATKAVIAGQEP